MFNLNSKCHRVKLYEKEKKSLKLRATRSCIILSYPGEPDERNVQVKKAIAGGSGVSCVPGDSGEQMKKVSRMRQVIQASQADFCLNRIYGWHDVKVLIIIANNLSAVQWYQETTRVDDILN